MESSIAFANSLIISSSSSSSSSQFTSNSLVPSRISFPTCRSQWKKKKNNISFFTTHCSAEDPNKDQTPIELKYPAYPTVMDINQIREILPHRFPFLFVDRVIEYTPGVSVVAIKNVTINDNFFPGHFPERPIMPGVLMVEECVLKQVVRVYEFRDNRAEGAVLTARPKTKKAMAQVGGLVMLQSNVGGSRDKFFFAGIDKVRFRKPVIAGDTLVMRMTLTKLQKRFGVAKMEGKAYVGGDIVCEGEFLMALGSD